MESEFSGACSLRMVAVKRECKRWELRLERMKALNVCLVQDGNSNMAQL